MRFNRLQAFAASLALAAVMALAPSRSNADVVFGNLGANGTNALSGVNNDITSTDLVAVGFTTGTGASTPLKLQTITLGLFSETEAPYTLSIYATGTDGNPSNTVVATSAATTVGATGKYTFAFSNPLLTASTTYWIKPLPGLSWYTPASGLTPVAYNGSGYTSPGPGLVSFDSGSTWVSDELVNNGRYSFSVSAVPEPSTYALTAIGLSIAGLVRARRRKASV